MLANQSTGSANTFQEELARYSNEFELLRATIDLAFASGARPSKAHEDRVVFPLGVSCRDIFEEILSAIMDGHGRSALRSARTMYECVVFSRYICLHPEKAEDFLEKFNAQWAKVIQNTPAPEENMPEVHKSLCATVPKYAMGKPVGARDLDWSGSHTHKMAKEAGALSDLHSLAFDYASAFVHPSAVFIINQMSKPAPGGRVIQVSAKPQDAESRQAFCIAHDLILNAVDLRLNYSSSTVLKERLEECKKDFVRIWGYPPHI
jgi:hypothetical protein